MVLAETTGAETIHYLHGLDLVAESDGVTTEYFTYDGLGSVRQLTGPAAIVLQAQTFDPYGNLYASGGVGGSAFGFTGEYQDASGLLFLRARYYNPAQGRFFQMDPSRQEQNPYQYGLGNPVYYADPNGLSVCPPGREYRPGEGCTLTSSSSRHLWENFFGSPGVRRTTVAVDIDWESIIEFCEGVLIGTSNGIIISTPEDALFREGDDDDDDQLPPFAVSSDQSQIQEEKEEECGDDEDDDEECKAQPEWVVRGGVAAPQSLKDAFDRRPHLAAQIHGLSVQYNPGLSHEDLARAGDFPNTRYSYATREELAEAVSLVGYEMAIIKTTGVGFHYTLTILDSSGSPLTILPWPVAEQLSIVWNVRAHPEVPN